MAYLVLTNDEIALLRFTCDLFFVEESPLYNLDVEQREPSDYGASYQLLLEKGVIDPRSFRITDPALNRLAPTTECDARVVHLHQHSSQSNRHQDYFILDEISVSYQHADRGHILGSDMDCDEFVEYLARRFVPRKSAGDLLDIELTHIETLAFTHLCRAYHQHQNDRILLKKGIWPPSALPPSLATERTSLPHTSENALLSVLAVQTLPANASGESTFLKPKKNGVSDAWKNALDRLLQLNLFEQQSDHLIPGHRVKSFWEAVKSAERHTFVRYDFGEDEWFIRETTFFPSEGSLYWVGLTPEGMVGFKELTGGNLKTSLEEAIGPLKVGLESIEHPVLHRHTSPPSF